MAGVNDARSEDDRSGTKGGKGRDTSTSLAGNSPARPYAAPGNVAGTPPENRASVPDKTKLPLAHRVVKYPGDSRPGGFGGGLPAHARL